MPNSQDLLTEEQLDQLEGKLIPVEVESPVPGRTAPSVPFLGGSGSTEAFFSGSLPPQFQLDSAFSRARVLSDRVPKNALMPFGIQSNPSTNAAIQSTSKNVVIQTQEATPASADDDTIKLNLQTGTSYTVQQSDLNKLISISNVSGGTVYLPPVSGSTNAAVTNHQDAPFNSGNTTILSSVATSVFVFTATAAIAVGDFMFLAVRNVSSHSDSATATMKDNLNSGNWTKASVAIDDASAGTDTLSLFWVRNTVAIAAGGSVTLTLTVTFSGTAFNPDANQFWAMSGIKTAGAEAQNSGLSSGSTFSSGGLTASALSTYISLADSNNGGLATQTPANSQGLPWTGFGGSSSAARFNYLTGITNGLVNDVYTPASSGHGFIDILQSFIQSTAADIQQLTTNFFCYIENTGAGTFNLVSSVPIDGSTLPLPLTQNQGTLLVWDAASQSWYTERGMGGGGGPDVDFYQTVQQAGVSKVQENRLNFLGPITATDNAGNSSTDIAVPDMVGDSGAGGTHGLVPAPGAGDAAANKFLKASGAFAVPPNMVGDSGSGGTAGYAPAPVAGDNAAGKFLTAGGTYANPGTNPVNFNTGLAYAIAAGFALG